MKGIYPITILLAITTVLFGCLVDKGELTENPTPEFCDSLGATYVDTMQVLIDLNCAYSGCHFTGFANGDFTSYASMQSFGALNQSQIGTRVASGNMPQGNPFPDSIKVIFQCWADAGFPQQ